jgi:CBS-domain-containing membrane protein
VNVRPKRSLANGERLSRVQRRTFKHCTCKTMASTSTVKRVREQAHASAWNVALQHPLKQFPVSSWKRRVKSASVPEAFGFLRKMQPVEPRNQIEYMNDSPMVPHGELPATALQRTR